MPLFALPGVPGRQNPFAFRGADNPVRLLSAGDRGIHSALADLTVCSFSGQSRLGPHDIVLAHCVVPLRTPFVFTNSVWASRPMVALSAAGPAIRAAMSHAVGSLDIETRETSTPVVFSRGPFPS